MARTPKKSSFGQKQRGGRQEQEIWAQPQATERAAPKRDTSPIVPLSEAQKRYCAALKSAVLTFATGPAGTGKTWLSAATAAQLLESGEIDKIIITRPAVEAGESMGFLPGEIEDKFGPYLAPFRNTFDKRLGKSYVELLMKRGVIEAAPLAYMRGRNFEDAFIILDEAQNTTPAQMKMFLTRIGRGCRVVVNGDTAQKDIQGLSGLEDAIARCSWIPSVSVVTFSKEDIVRSGIVQDIVSSYESLDPLVRKPNARF